jgi:formylglycine-generating enzyme required for sulfatase activity
MNLFCACVVLMMEGRAEVYSGWPFDAKEAARRQSETAKSLKVPLHLSLKLGAGIALKLNLIPAGKFVMGAALTETSVQRTNESPQHEVTITRPFYIGIYKVTQEQFEQIMGTNPGKFAGKDNPVDAVSWEDADLFCRKASAKVKRIVRLPTEAQWEYAARAGTATPYYYGADESQVGEYAWYRENAKGRTHPVGQKPPNPWGLYDVHGLLWEYCSDFYADSYAGSKTNDPDGPPSGTVHSARGGTWGSRPPFLRSAIRISGPVGSAVTKDIMSRFGFRVIVVVE